MNIEKVNKIKLKENEVIQIISEKDDLLLCKFADKLGLTWELDSSYLNHVFYNDFKNDICYNLNKGTCCYSEFYLDRGWKVISLNEWLSRHNETIYPKWVDIKEKEFNSSMLNVGEMMRIEDESPSFNGLIIIKIYNKFMCLSNINYMFDLDACFKGKKLPKGYIFNLKAK